ncbi:replication-relaxation family protein [Patescibacteria group bacterium]|jgi:hypothetical protein|nr:replication-relaxation family protein [Patescibacteria group bacterium]
MTSEPVTPKQLEILLLLYRFRFLNRIHIQKFLNHKTHSRITPWLKDLTDRNIIHRIYSKTFTDIHTPAVYYLANKSRHILKDHELCSDEVLSRVYREQHRSQTFRNHCLLLADLYFHFQTAAQRQNTTCHFYTATDLAGVAYAPQPLPDAYITIKDNKKIKRYFLDAFSDTAPMFAVRRRIHQYCRYYSGNYWQDHHRKTFPTILLICPSERIKNSLLRFIPHQLVPEGVEISFYLALKEDIQKRGIQSDTWEAA